MRIKEIDEVLHRNAQLFQNLVIDSTKTEKAAAKVQERKNLRSVRHYAPELIDRLLNDGDK